MLIRKITSLLFCLISCTALFAQEMPDLTRYKTDEEKTKALKHICDSLAAIEDYVGIRKAARFALQQLPGDLYNTALFNYYLGSSWEGALDRDSAIYYHEISLTAATKAENDKRIRGALQRLLFLYHSAGNKTKGDRAAARLQKILDTTVKNEIGKYDLLVSLGNYFNENAQYEKGIQYLTTALQTQKKLLSQKKIDDSSDIAITQLNIANILLRIKQPGKALEYINDAREYAAGYEIALSFYFESKVEALLNLGNVKNALVYYDSLYAKAQTGFASACGKNDVISMELAFAEHFLNTNNVDSALLFANKALQKSTQWSSPYQQAQVGYIMGKVYFVRKDYPKALSYLNRAESFCRDANLETYASLVQTIAQCYAGLGQWQQAYTYYEKYAPLRDSLYDEASKQSLANAEAKYQNKEKQREITIKNTQLIYAHKQKLWLIAGLVLALLIVALLGIIYRSKRQSARILNEKNIKLAQLNNDLEEANQTKAKLFGIISHDLRSPISQVYQFLKLQQTNPALLNDEQKMQLNNKIQTATGSLLETMEDLLLWSKTQMNQFTTEMQVVDINDVIAECLQLLQLNSEAKGLVIEHNIAPGTVVNSDPYFLQAILRNLLQNAIKASPQNGVVKIDFEDKRLSVINQGMHFSQLQYLQILASDGVGKSLSGLGLRIVDELSKKINAQVYFADTNNNSTCVQMTFS